ncbi:TPA: efflux transporter outer membrane subunit [Serratia odorifera]|nr:TolC family protein [Serratia odorifera]
MLIIRRLTIVLIPLLSAGCAVGPDRPPLTTLPITSTLSDNSPTPDQWWALYQDPALNHAVGEALRNNRDLRVAAANLLAVRALQRETDAQKLPDTSLTADGGYGSSLDDQIEAALGQSDNIRTGSRYSAGMSLHWELDLFGRLRSQSSAAQAHAESVQAEEDGVRVWVAAETTRAWLSACSYGQRIGIAQQTLALVVQEQQITEALHKSGAGAMPGVVRAQGLVYQTRTELPVLKAKRQRVLAELAVLMGRLPSSPPEQALVCQKPPTLAYRGLPDSEGLALLRRRPDVREAQQQLTAATANIRVATADLYPQISLGASMLSSAHQPEDWGKEGATVWSIGPLISWSFPNITAARARIAQAGAKESAALAHFDGTILTALKEVQVSLTGYDSALQQQKLLQQAAENSRHALRLSTLAYQDGATTALDYLDSQRNDVAVQSELARANTRLIDAQVTLFKALGGGWQQAPSVVIPAPQRSKIVSSILFPPVFKRES